MEPIIPMTAGLLLDICGSLLVIKPLWQFFNLQFKIYDDDRIVVHLTDNVDLVTGPISWSPTGLGVKIPVKVKVMDNNKNKIKSLEIKVKTLEHLVDDIITALESQQKKFKFDANSAKSGFVLLGIGFFLILIASWINHLK